MTTHEKYRSQPRHNGSYGQPSTWKLRQEDYYELDASLEFQASLIQSENLGHKIIIIEEGREKGRESRQANHHYKPAELLTAPPSNIRITVSIKNTLIAPER